VLINSKTLHLYRGRGQETDPLQASNSTSYQYVAVKKSSYNDRCADGNDNNNHDYNVDDKEERSRGGTKSFEANSNGNIREKNTRMSQRLSLIWTAGMEIDEDDYVIEDKESICRGHNGGGGSGGDEEIHHRRNTLNDIEERRTMYEMDVKDMPININVPIVENAVDDENSDNHHHINDDSGSNHEGNNEGNHESNHDGDDDSHDDSDDDDDESRYSKGVRPTSTSMDNSYDRIEAQEYHDVQRLLESL